MEDVVRNSDVLAQCTGKAAFETLRLAKQVADRRSRRGRRGAPYRCRHCGEYHIGLLARYHQSRRDR